MANFAYAITTDENECTMLLGFLVDPGPLKAVGSLLREIPEDTESTPKLSNMLEEQLTSIFTDAGLSKQSDFWSIIPEEAEMLLDGFRYGAYNILTLAEAMEYGEIIILLNPFDAPESEDEDPGDGEGD